MLSTGVVPGRIRRAIGSRTACPYHCGPPRQHGTSARRDRKAALAQAQAQHLLNTLRMITIRKRRLDQSDKAVDDSAPLDLTRVATIAYSSEDPAHPVEHLVDERTGPGGSRWVAAQPDSVEQIVVEFDRPQSVARLVYEVEETQQERTQEVRVEASTDRGQSYRQVLVQEYTFSPRGATFQREDLRLELHDLSQLRLTIVPNKHGSGVATLTSLRLYP